MFGACICMVNSALALVWRQCCKHIRDDVIAHHKASWGPLAAGRATNVFRCFHHELCRFRPPMTLSVAVAAAPQRHRPGPLPGAIAARPECCSQRRGRVSLRRLPSPARQPSAVTASPCPAAGLEAVAAPAPAPAARRTALRRLPASACKQLVLLMLPVLQVYCVPRGIVESIVSCPCYLPLHPCCCRSRCRCSTKIIVPPSQNPAGR